MKVMRHLTISLGIGLGTALACAAYGYRYLAPIDHMPVTPLQIRTMGGEVSFKVEVATTRHQQELGLMYRRSLATGAGMLFDLKQPKQISLWMKDTYIPLDIIFIDAGGKIVRIAPNAKPLSKTLIPSIFPVRAVLEISGGEARRLGLELGNTVVHAVYDQAGGGDMRSID